MGADGRGAFAAEGVECGEGKLEFLPETGGFWCILGLLFTFKKA